jgi:hypothetical protein
MADFIDTVTDKKVQDRLIKALNKSKPFRNFKYEIDNSGEYRQKWFNFKEQEYCKWIDNQIADLNKNYNKKTYVCIIKYIASKYESR